MKKVNHCYFVNCRVNLYLENTHFVGNYYHNLSWHRLLISFIGVLIKLASELTDVPCSSCNYPALYTTSHFYIVRYECSYLNISVVFLKIFHNSSHFIKIVVCLVFNCSLASSYFIHNHLKKWWLGRKL